MNFQVPQFIEVEDKIFGPLTFKQFLYVAGGASLAYIIFNLEFIPFLVFRLVLAIVALGFGLALAFYKINERPFVVVLEAAIKYTMVNKLYLWRKSAPTKNSQSKQPTVDNQPQITVPKLSQSRLNDLTWSLDVNEKIK